MSQDVFASQCGVGARSQRNYEAGERLPDAAYLARLAATGADVLYILTGSRSQPISVSAGLSHRERALLDNYGHASESGKKVIEGTANLAAQPKTAARSGR